MISCTEFIPAYSELFKYIHNSYGFDAVHTFWAYLFKPDGKGIPLINFVKKDGLKGAFDYWSGTLKEEASDVTRWLNLKQGWAKSEMHYCPSKGRLLQLKEELGIEPYEHYCDHCDYYREALKQGGLEWIRDHTRVDKASCSSMIYDPKVFRGIMCVDEDTVAGIYLRGAGVFPPGFPLQHEYGCGVPGDHLRGRCGKGLSDPVYQSGLSQAHGKNQGRGTQRRPGDDSGNLCQRTRTGDGGYRDGREYFESYRPLVPCGSPSEKD